MMILDTSVLGYAVGGEHPLRDPCRRMLAALAIGGLRGATTVEVIQEFTHIQARRRPREEATALARDYMASVQLLQTTPEDLLRAFTIFEHSPALGMFDAVLAAVALNHGADGLVSADRGFGFVSGLRWIDPTTSEFEGILRDSSREALDRVAQTDRPESADG